MSEYHVVIRREDSDYQVWLDASEGDEPDANALVLGGATSREGALRCAQEELAAALARVEAALRREVEVLP